MFHNWKVGFTAVDPIILIAFDNAMLEIRARLSGEEDPPAERARVFSGARGIEPRGNTHGTYRMIAWQADFPLDDPGLRA